MAVSLGSLGYQNVAVDVAASQTDSVLVAAVPTMKIRARCVAVSCGASPSTVVFNSKPAGAGAAISPTFNNSIVMPEAASGWFETKRGEGLSVSTGVGSITGILVVHEVVDL